MFSSASRAHPSQEGLWWTERSCSCISTLAGLRIKAKHASARKYLRRLGNLCSNAVYNQGRLTLIFYTISCGLHLKAANNRVNTVLVNQSKTKAMFYSAMMTSLAGTENISKTIANPPTLHIRQSLPRPGKATIPPQFHQSPIGQHLLDTPHAPYITIKTSSRSSSHSISSLRRRSDFHEISESLSLQTKRIRLLLKDLLNLLNSFHWLIVSTNENSSFPIS